MRRTASARLLVLVCLVAACASPKSDKAITGASFVERLPDVLVRADDGKLACVPDQLSGLTLAAVTDWTEVEPQSDAQDGRGLPIAHGFGLDPPSPSGFGDWRIENLAPSDCGFPDETLLPRDAVTACVIDSQGWVHHPADIRIEADPVILVVVPGQIVALRPASETWWRVRDPTEAIGWMPDMRCGLESQAAERLP